MNRVYLFWALVVLNLVDIGLTTLILERGGQEANPWVDMFIQAYGYFGMFLAKSPLILMGIIIYFLWAKVNESWQISTVKVLYLLNIGFFVLNCYSLFVYSTTFHV